jgi:hypothetical protein
MSITINEFLEKYKVSDIQLSSYDNHTKQIITEIINGNVINSEKMHINYLKKINF